MGSQAQLAVLGRIYRQDKVYTNQGLKPNSKKPGFESVPTSISRTEIDIGAYILYFIEPKLEPKYFKNSKIKNVGTFGF